MYLLAIIIIVALGCVCIYLSVKDDELKKQTREKELSDKQRLYEVSILRSIQERIGYSLDIEKVIDTLTGSLKNLFPFSSASSIIIKDDRLVFNMYIEERVNTRFTEDVKKSMLASLATLVDTPLPKHIEENRTGFIPDDTQQSGLASFFHVPLVINGKITGLINVSSTTPGLYKETDMTILYQMTTQASNALSRLKEVITTEESKLLAMIGSLTDGIILLDDKKQITLINDFAKMLFNFQKSGVSIFDVIQALPKDYNLPDKIEEAISTKKTVEEKEVRLGGNILQIFVIPVPGTNGDLIQTAKPVIGVVILMHDITLEKSLSEMKETFTYSIVHELRSPLTAIKASTELLSSEIDMNENQHKLVHIITEQTKRMLDDINILLDAAKMESGHFSVAQKPYSIKTLIDDSVIMFTPQAQEKQITLISHVDNDLPDAYIDPIRINQVLTNLISNSMKFTKAGGTIGIRASLNRDHTKPKSPLNPAILISVADTGEGIPKEKQATLFSKFYQASSAFVPGQQGTGLGLYISKGIIEAHGGTINLISLPTKGTTISFILPVVSSQTQQSSPAQHTQPLTVAVIN